MWCVCGEHVRVCCRRSHRERERERDTDMHTHTHTHTHTERHAHTHTHIHTDRHTHRHTHIDTHIHKWTCSRKFAACIVIIQVESEWVLIDSREIDWVGLRCSRRVDGRVNGQSEVGLARHSIINEMGPPHRLDT